MASSHPVKHILLALSISALSLTLPACQSTGSSEETWLSPLLETITPQTPGQVARDAFNLYDADKRRRSVVQLASASFGGEEVYVRMYRILLDDPDASVRAASIKALGLHGAPDDVPKILPSLEDPAAFVRWETAQALQKLHHPDAVAPLIKSMTADDDADVRAAAAFALGQYPQRRVFDALVGALDDSDHSVTFAAHQSLQVLTGYDFGSDGALWLIWAKDKPNSLFTHQEPYTWQPFVKPRGFWDKLQFWKSAQTPAPRSPAGL